MKFKCGQCGFICDRIEIETIIDHIYGHNQGDGFIINREKAAALNKFLYSNGYISYEFHPLVLDLIDELDKYLDNKKENQNERRS